MEAYVARDACGRLMLFDDEPIIDPKWYDCWIPQRYGHSIILCEYLYSDEWEMFKDLNFEDDPIKVHIPRWERNIKPSEIVIYEIQDSM